MNMLRINRNGFLEKRTAGNNHNVKHGRAVWRDWWMVKHYGKEIGIMVGKNLILTPHQKPGTKLRIKKQTIIG